MASINSSLGLVLYRNTIEITDDKMEPALNITSSTFSIYSIFQSPHEMDQLGLQSEHKLHSPHLDSSLNLVDETY
jgi:hypothetical protein